MTTPFLPDELGTQHRISQYYPALRAFFDIREMLRETEDVVCDAEEQVFQVLCGESCPHVKR